MGYRTRYSFASITGENADLFKEDFEQELVQCEYGPLNVVFHDGLFCAGEEIKWYDWREDLKQISEDYPNTLFELDGEGESSGDIWRAYARNGEVQVAKASLAFDPPSDELLNNVAMLEKISEVVKRRRLMDQRIDLLQQKEDIERQLEELG